MRFTILRPANPLDIRHLEIKSVDHLREQVPSISDHADEAEVVRAVRDLFPDAVAMPVPVRVGVGDMMLMGILPSVRTARNPDDIIPFVLFVQASPETSLDHQMTKKRRQWNRHLWRSPVLKPRGDFRGVDLNVQFHDMEVPMPVTGYMWRRSNGSGVYANAGGCTVLTIETLNGSMSIEFVDGIPDELAGASVRVH